MKKLCWIDTDKKHTLSARVWVSNLDITDQYGFAIAASESDMDPIQVWCEEHDCGVRTSFDTFRFRNQQEISMFLLRWG